MALAVLSGAIGVTLTGPVCPLNLMMIVVLGSAPSVQDGRESGLASVQDRAQVGRSIQGHCHLTLCAL